MKKDDIILSRSNMTTIVKGKRCKTLGQDVWDETIYEKAERKFGDFTQTFKIPEEYDRRWNTFEMINGILSQSYLKDHDDIKIEKESILGEFSTESNFLN